MSNSCYKTSVEVAQKYSKTFLFLRFYDYSSIFYLSMSISMYVCVHTFINPVLCVLLFRWVPVQKYWYCWG
jgi:hypothetical protein